MTPSSENAAPVAPDGAGRPRGRCWRPAELAMVCFAVAVSCGAARSQAATEPVTLNLVNAEIEAVARTMAATTGRTIVVDRRVKGTINLSTEKPLLAQAAFEQFLAAIRLSGFSIVESGVRLAESLHISHFGVQRGTSLDAIDSFLVHCRRGKVHTAGVLVAARVKVAGGDTPKPMESA